MITDSRMKSGRTLKNQVIALACTQQTGCRERSGTHLDSSFELLTESEGNISHTGASGFVGTELVKQLLTNGYTVRAGVQKPGSAGYSSSNSESEHLLKFAGGLAGNLEIFEADLCLPETLDKPLDGAVYV